MGTPVAAKGNRGFLITRLWVCGRMGLHLPCKECSYGFESRQYPLKRQAREACQQIDKSDNPFSSYPVMGTDKQNNLGH